MFRGIDSRRKRMTYSRTQILELEKEFHYNNFLKKDRRLDLSVKLQLTEGQIKIWFQNRRMKQKKEQRRVAAANRNSNTDNNSSSSDTASNSSEWNIGSIATRNWKVLQQAASTSPTGKNPLLVAWRCSIKRLFFKT